MDDNQNSNPEFDKLPIEIIEHIFSFLPLSDIRYAGETCLRWMISSQHSLFAKKNVLRFTRIDFSPNKKPMAIFLKSKRTFKNVYMSGINFYNDDDNLFWDKFGEHIQQISFNWCQFSNNKFIDILHKLPNLKSLEISRCNNLFENGKFLKFSKDDIIPISFKNLESLQLTNNWKFNDDIFIRIVAIMPNLETFNCCVYNQNEIYESCLPLLKQESKTLKYLTVTDNFIKNIFDDEVPKIDNLKLKGLKISYGFDFITFNLIGFLKNQIDLQVLNINGELEDSDLKIICMSLKNLEILKINESKYLTDMGIVEVINLKKLKVFHIINCSTVSEYGLIQGIAKNCNLILVELCTEEIEYSLNGMQKIAQNLPNLLILNLTFENSTCLEIFQSIFLYMVKLTTLEITHLDIEAHPVNDIIPYDGLNNPIFTISRLKNLQHLVLEIDRDIPGISIEALMFSRNLKEITFRSRHKVSPSVLERFFKNCSSLENIDFSYWNVGIDDETIKLIVKNVKRLRVLRVAGCKNVTELSLRFLERICNQTKFKEICLSGCSICINNISNSKSNIIL